MCSWCWGFSPVLDRLVAEHGDDLRVTLALGALGRGDQPMRGSDRAQVRGHWEHVRAASGQPFDFAFFDRPAFIYDTEPACRAVAVARSLDGRLALPFLAAVQRAFYGENRDVTRSDELRRIAAAMGLEETAFAQTLQEPGTRRAVAVEFAQTAALGVTGYPTLLALRPGRPQVITIGWRPYAEVEAALLRAATTD